MGTSLELTLSTALSHAEITGPGFDRLAAFWETHAALDPEGEFATTWIDLLDGNGDESVPGCDPLPPDCQEDRAVSVNEIRCNHLLYSIFSSDLDLDLDGVKEHLSYGYKATLVPAILGQP